MPSTIVHLGTQAFLTRLSWRGAPLLWVYLGGVLPDVPWIFQRLVTGIVPGVDLAGLRLYVVAQASLAGCLLLAAAVASVASAWTRVLALLSSGAVLHLLLDAVEIKRANGVLLFAPLGWREWQLGWFWTESLAAILWALLAALWVAWHWRKAAAEVPELRLSRARVLSVGVFLGLWVIVPWTLMPAARRADVHFVRTLLEVEARPGRPVELQRAHAFERPGPDTVETLEREVLLLEGLEIEGSQEVSIRGRFVDERTIRVTDSYVHPPGLRDLGSYAGLAAAAFLWGGAGWRAVRAKRSKREERSDAER